MHDWKATPVEIGSRVLYSGRKSSYIRQVIGVVEDIRETPSRWGIESEVRIRVTVSNAVYGTRPGELTKWIRLDHVTVL